ncbi:polysaccharide biosynthesis/export family protein [Hallerella porci]|uniref:Protein involved in polysaccharide export with SLBB domain n=1 Tax=Hallerella porci TaxID=1945871 RepID=A0ABX5LR61_9BACT|nr:polysaccharide biosynthesis/export family protein [Hallerella porci]PWL00168.1 protein involved in polysaccharide export with SLBB domain [Hallerella porci]
MHFLKILMLSLFLCVPTILASEEMGGAYPAMTGLQTTNPAFQRNSVTMQPSYSEGVVDSNYLLGPGDYLDIMLENSYLSAKVYPDGSIIIEECGIVNVAGKTIAQAREEILKAVAKRYDPKYCFVQLAQMKKMIVNVMGAVPHVGQVFVEPQTRLTRLLKLVGDILPQGRDDDVRIIRGNDTIHVNCFKIYNEGDFASDIIMEPGDQIFVPFADMNNAITIILPNYRSAVSYVEGKTVSDYFERAGGNRIPNLGYQSVTIRKKDNSSESIPVSLADKVVPPLGAEIEYTMKPLLVYVGGAVAGVGRQQYDPSWHALDYISAAGVLTTTGSFDQVKVIRGDRETIYVNATRDPILPGDYIEIPKSTYERFKDFTLFVASLLTVVSSAFIIYVNYK